MGDEVLAEQTDIFGEQRHEHLENEPLSEGTIYPANEQRFEDEGQLVGGFAGDFFAVVFECRSIVRGKEKCQGTVTVWQID